MTTESPFSQAAFSSLQQCLNWYMTSSRHRSFRSHSGDVVLSLFRCDLHIWSGLSLPHLFTVRLLAGVPLEKVSSRGQISLPPLAVKTWAFCPTAGCLEDLLQNAPTWLQPSSTQWYPASCPPAAAPRPFLVLAAAWAPCWGLQLKSVPCVHLSSISPAWGLETHTAVFLNSEGERTPAARFMPVTVLFQSMSGIWPKKCFRQFLWLHHVQKYLLCQQNLWWHCRGWNLNINVLVVLGF